MLRNKTLLLFLLKALIIYVLLSLPFSFYDEGYGNLYRKMSGALFGKFREKGFVIFNESKEPATTHINVGNCTQIHPDGSCNTASADMNTRYLGFIPAILMISLTLASPVPWKRKLIALLAGLILLTLLIIFKQWIALLAICEQNPWLDLTNFTGTTKKLLAFTNTFISSYSSTILYFVVPIWLLVTFRLEDFKVRTEKK